MTKTWTKLSCHNVRERPFDFYGGGEGGGLEDFLKKKKIQDNDVNKKYPG